MRKLLALSLALLLMVACKPQVPSDYLQPGEMEDILYDYHLAQAIAQRNEGGSEAERMVAYREMVFRKHGVTEAEFDSSMVYYQRHTERLKGIYDNLAKRLTAEAQSLGASVDDVNSLGDISLSGDTANIWKGEQAIVLSPNAPFNHYSFEVEADTSFHKGDRFILNFKTQFIYQDGMRDGVAYIAVTFDNDSVGTNVTHISSDGKQTLQIFNDKRLGIKSINGFISLSKNMESPSQTTLRLMFVSQLSLIRVHQPELPAPASEPTDSAQVSSSDSLRKARAEELRQEALPPRRSEQLTPVNRHN